MTKKEGITMKETCESCGANHPHFDLKVLDIRPFTIKGKGMLRACPTCRGVEGDEA